MSAVASKYEPEEVSELVNSAYNRVQKLWLDYEMVGNDFKVFADESPRHMDRIGELEALIGPPSERSEIEESLEKWVKNYEYVFRRRHMLKRKKAS